MTLGDRIASLVRTGVPYLVGLGLAWLARKTGIVLSDSSSAELTAWVGFLAGTAYYAIVRWAEVRWPRLGWLLGLAKTPSYQVVPGEVLSTKDQRL